MRRGEIWIANLNPVRGREAGKVRPVIVFQDNSFTNAGAVTVISIPLTTKLWPGFDPIRITISARERLLMKSYAMIEKTRAVDIDRFGEGPLTTLTAVEMAAVEKSLLAVLGIY